MKYQTLVLLSILFLFFSCDKKEMNSAASLPEDQLFRGYFILDSQDGQRLIHIQHDRNLEADIFFHAPLPAPGENPQWIPMAQPAIIEETSAGFKVILEAFNGEWEELYTLTPQDEGYTGTLGTAGEAIEITLTPLDLNALIAEINKNQPNDDLLELELPDANQTAMDNFKESKKPSQEELMAAFEEREAARKVEDNFMRLAIGTFQDAYLAGGDIELIFEVGGENRTFLINHVLSPIESIPFIMDDQVNEDLIEEFFMLPYKTYMIEDARGEDTETDVLQDIIPYTRGEFSQAGFESPFTVYQFTEDVIEAIRDEDWESLTYVIQFPMELTDTPIGALNLKNPEDFVKFRPYIFTKTMIQSIVNQDYSNIICTAEGFALGIGDLWIIPGQENPLIYKINPRE